MKLVEYPSDWRSVIWILFTLALMAFPFFQPVPGTLLVPFYLLLFYFGINANLINHNHIHVPTFRVALLNRVFDYMLSITRGASCTFIKFIHNNHHHFEGKQGDWFDVANEGEGPRVFRPLVYIYRTTRKFKRKVKSVLPDISPELKRKYYLERVVVNAFLLVCLVLNWKATLLYVLPCWIVGNGFVVLTNLLHHRECDVESKENVARDYLSPIENWLFFNGGYHSMHHLKPGTHWSLLPTQHRVFINSKHDPTLESGSMFAYLIQNYCLPWPRRSKTTSSRKGSRPPMTD